MFIKILNLGCGGRYSYQRKLQGKDVIQFDLDPKAKWRDIGGDAHNLPFYDKVFEHVFCSHVLEHLQEPILALKEMRRVTIKTVVLKIPNALHYYKYGEDDGHLFSWTPSSFFNLLNTTFEEFKIEPSFCQRYSPLNPKLWYAFLRIGLAGFPNELTAVCKC